MRFPPLIPLLLITVIVIAFFSQLFIPEPKLFYTPDFGRSDIWNFNYPLRDFLATSLKKAELPFWNKAIGTGFPVFAESQVGSLFLPNLILFFFLPTWLAFNLSYVLLFFINFLGSFLFFKRNQLTQAASLFAALAFSFGGFFIVHLHHTNLVQSASLLPWLFLATQNLWEKPTKLHTLVFALLLSQQIFAGFFQTTFITLVGIGIFFLAKIWFERPKAPAKKITVLAVAVLAGTALAAPQLIPTYELTTISMRQQPLGPRELFRFPYPPQHLISFLLPNFFGTPSDGSYPPYSDNWGIYWENTAYLGVLPLLLLLAALLKPKKTSWEKSLWILMIFSLLLVLGKNSPLIVLFRLPGFNSFRVPSRFLLVSSFALAGLGGAGFDRVRSAIFWKKLNKRLQLTSIVVVFTIAAVDLVSFGYKHHPLVPLNKALETPETSQLLKTGARIYTHPDQFLAWNQIFLANGWQDITPYLYLRNGLNANLNLLFDIPNLEAYAGMWTLRQYAYQESLNLKTLSAAAADYVISPTQLNEIDQFSQIASIQPPRPSLPTYYLYQNQAKLERIRFAGNFQVAKPQEFFQLVNQEDFSFAKTAILEEDPQENFEEPNVKKIEISKDENQRLSLKTTTDTKTLLVIADSYYPGWKATINGKPAPILAANLNQRALILPAGQNQVELYFDPKTFRIGIAVSASVFSLIALLILLDAKAWKMPKTKKTRFWGLKSAQLTKSKIRLLASPQKKESVAASEGKLLI